MSRELNEPPAVEQFLSGTLTQVDVAGIERQLRELWQAAVRNGDEQQAQSVARACVLNLILYSSDADAEFTAGNLLDEIALQHPCRALLAISRPSEEMKLAAWVSARCHLPNPGSTKQVCCEQVTVLWEGQGVYELPSVVIPLLVPDLPVYHYLRTDDFTGEALEPFLKSVDRVIVDSSRWSVRSLASLCQYMSGKNHQPVLSDLDWSRILEWRRLLANAFDNSGSGFNVSDLSEIQKVELEFTPPVSCQVVLLIAWLSSRLGWEPLSGGLFPGDSGPMLFADAGRRIEVVGNPVPSDVVPEGQLCRVQLDMKDGKSLTVSRQLRESNPILTSKYTIPSGSTDGSVAAVGDLSESRLLGAQLESLPRDAVYEQALSMISRCSNISRQES